MADLYFSKDHEWIAVAGATALSVSPTMPRLSLGDIVFAEVPPSHQGEGQEAASSNP